MRTLRLGLIAAMILGLVGGGGIVASAQEGAAAEGTSETLYELTVPRWALPNGLHSLAAETWTVEAGTDVTGEPRSSQANESMRGRVFLVTSGTFLIEPTTDALLWRESGSTPEIVPASEAVTLGPGEAIYLPGVDRDEVDPERYVRVANPGTEDATGFSVHVCEDEGDSLKALASGIRADRWGGQLFGVWNAPGWMAADEVLFRMQRHRADPGTTMESSGYPSTAVYMVESGQVESVMSGPGGEQTETWRTGTQFGTMAVEDLGYALTVVGDEAASFLELVAIPRSSTAG